MNDALLNPPVLQALVPASLPSFIPADAQPCAAYFCNSTSPVHMPFGYVKEASTQLGAGGGGTGVGTGAGAGGAGGVGAGGGWFRQHVNVAPAKPRSLQALVASKVETLPPESLHAASLRDRSSSFEEHAPLSFVNPAA